LILYCDADDVGTENDCDNCVDDNAGSNDYIIPSFVNGIQTSGLRVTGFGGAIMVLDNLVTPDQMIPSRFQKF